MGRFDLALATFLIIVLAPQWANSQNAGQLCDLAPVEFSGASYTNALQLIGQSATPINKNMTPVKTVFSFGPLHKADGFNRPVRDIFVNAVYDAEGAYDDYYKQVYTLVPDVGCSSQTVHSINWSLDHDYFLGHFHVKYVSRWCWKGANGDIATYEVDYYNKVGVAISADGRELDPVKYNWSTDNVSDFSKVIIQGLGALGQIMTASFVKQEDIEVLNGHGKEEEALKFIDSVENSFLSPTKGAGPLNPNGSTFTVDFLYTDAKFSQAGTHPILLVNAKQNPKLVPNDSEACEFHDFLHILLTQVNNVPPGGTEYAPLLGDSLWKIATKFYGDGRFHLLLAASNKIPDNEMDSISAGKKLKIEPIGVFRANNQLLFVTKGDSIWEIAKEHQGGTQAFSALEKTNSGLVTNPDRIYPIEVLRAVEPSKPPPPSR